MKQELTIIAAIGRNNELGKNGDLIWKIKGDMRHFKKTTQDGILIMGSKTFFSLPAPLKNRIHMVLTNNVNGCVERAGFDGDIMDAVVFTDSQERMEKELIPGFLQLDDGSNREVFVIGGGEVYKSYMSKATRLVLTEIDAGDKDADTFFPYVGFEWAIAKSVIGIPEPGEPNYRINTYVRRDA